MANYKSAYTGAEIDSAIGKANTAIQPVEGKGLSTNDYTTEEKTKLADIDMSSKQDKLVSGTNIKTINNQSILGRGNINVEGGGGESVHEVYIGNTQPTDNETLWIDTSESSSNLKTYLKTLKVGVLGDSITYGAGVNHNTQCYPALLQADFAEVINYGKSGTYIANNNMHSDPMCLSYTNMANDLDVIIVMGGTNDFASGSNVEGSFGTKDSRDNTTFYGGLNVLMSGLIEKYPGKEIFFCTPPHINYNKITSDTVKTNGKTLYDYRDAIIERGIYYSIPVIDIMGESGMDIAHSASAKTYFTTDGCHPNVIGQIRLHDRILQAIKNKIGELYDTTPIVLKYKDNNTWNILGDPTVTPSSTPTLESITASFVQGGNIIYENSDLSSLNQYLTVTALYSDSSTEVVSSGYTLSGTLTAGTSTITVTYEGKTATFTVNVTALTVESISAVFDSGTTKIYTSDTLDSLKQYLTVTATYTNGSTSVVATGYTLSGELNEGSNTITVSYSNKTTTFNVTAYEPLILQGISAVYTQGQSVVTPYTSLDSLKNNLVVTAEYTDGSTAVLQSGDYTLSGTLTVGTSTITVSYGGETDTFTVTVTESSEYTTYDYIQSPGQSIDAYFNSGINANNNTKFEVKFSTLTERTGNHGLIIAYQGTTYFGFNRASNSGFWSYGSEFKDISYSFSANDEYVVSNDGSSLSVNGTVVKTLSEATFEQTIPLFIFANNNNGAAGNFGYSYKLFYCKIWQGSTLVRNFVPAKRVSDDASGLLDTVNGVFYTNQGAGTFILGNVE